MPQNTITRFIDLVVVAVYECELDNLALILGLGVFGGSLAGVSMEIGGGVSSTSACFGLDFGMSTGISGTRSATGGGTD